jgi:hypothetical protein
MLDEYVVRTRHPKREFTRERRALSGGADNRCKDFPDNDGMLKVLWTRVAGTAAVARNGEAAL